MSNTACCEADLDDFFKTTENELLGELAARQKRDAPKNLSPPPLKRRVFIFEGVFAPIPAQQSLF